MDAETDDTLELIANVRSNDRKIACQQVASGVKAAQEKWIEAELIAEALTLELIEVAQTSLHSEKIAEHLRQIAAAVEDKANLH